MKLSFQFSNLCGTVYRSGNLLFTPDGRTILSPVGNRVTVFDLTQNKARTLPFESRKDIARIALSPNGAILMVIDEDGHALLVHFARGVVLSHLNFKEAVLDLKFSPNGRYIAVTHGKQIQLWKTPMLEKEFAPLRLSKTYAQHSDAVTFLEWSSDSRYLLSCSRDLTARIHAIHEEKNFIPTTFSGHRDHLVAAFFATDNDRVYSISRDGSLFCWVRNVEKTGWKLEAKHYFNQNAKVTSTSFNKKNNMLVVGFSSGVFALYELPDFNTIHTLSISSKKINTACINSTGEWLAFGCSKLGQLLVWEWQSETYVLKQQGHYYDMSCIGYSPDGQLIASGGDDGKVKLWNTTSGFAYVTFSDHKAPVSGVVFAPNGTAVFSSSYDGTVRAFDIIRYRNFRVFEPPAPAQLSGLAVDPSGEVVCAASLDTFEIYVWSVQTAKLLDTLGGHKAPISAVAFNPSMPVVASASWDKSVRVWDLYRGVQVETLTHNTEVIALAWRPDGKELCTSTLDGNLQFWDVEEASIVATIDGRMDISGGRRATDVRTAKNSTWGKAFNSLCYTADGSAVLAGGNSKYVCIYQVSSRILIKRFQTSHNRSLDGILDFLNSKDMTDAGPISLLDADRDSDVEPDEAMPGVRKDSVQRRPAIRTKHVQFAPSGRSWSAATTEGLLVFSLDDSLVFDPFELTEDVTPAAVEAAITDRIFLKALLVLFLAFTFTQMSFRINEQPLIMRAFEAVPPLDIQLVVRDMPLPYLQRFLRFLAAHFERSPHLELHMLWCLHLFSQHARYLKNNAVTLMPMLRALHRTLNDHYRNLSSLCDENRFSLDYLVELAKREEEPAPEPELIEDDRGIEEDAPKVIKPLSKKEQAKLAKRKRPTF